MVTIEGIVGIGKSTLIKVLQKKLVLNIVEQDFLHNISLADSYSNQEYIFEKQMIFLFSDYHLLLKNSKLNSPNITITDFSLERSEIMARLLITDEEYQKVFLPTYKYLLSRLDMRKMLIVMHGDIEKILFQIKKRNRLMEKNIDQEFLKIRQTQLLNNLKSFTYDKLIMLDIDAYDILNNDVIDWLVQEIIAYERERGLLI